jgi:hypothetical protein
VMGVLVRVILDDEPRRRESGGQFVSDALFNLHVFSLRHKQLSMACGNEVSSGKLVSWRTKQHNPCAKAAWL